MLLTNKEIETFLNQYEHVYDKASEIFHKKYELKYGKKNKSYVFVERLEVEDGKLMVVAEISNCSCCPNEEKSWYIDSKYLSMELDDMDALLLEEIRLEEKRLEEYRIAREKEEIERRNATSINLPITFIGNLPVGNERGGESEEDEKDRLEDLINKYPEFAKDILK